MIKEGLYEQIINEEVLENLNELDKEKYTLTYNFEEYIDRKYNYASNYLKHLI